MGYSGQELLETVWGVFRAFFTAGPVILTVFFTLLIHAGSKLVEKNIELAGILLGFWVFGMAAVFTVLAGPAGVLPGAALGIGSALLIPKGRLAMWTIAAAYAQGIFWTAVVFGGFVLAFWIFSVLASVPDSGPN